MKIKIASISPIQTPKLPKLPLFLVISASITPNLPQLPLYYPINPYPNPKIASENPKIPIRNAYKMKNSAKK